MTQHPGRPLPSGHRLLHHLRPLRLARGWSRIDLGLESRVSLRTIGRIEQGHPARLSTVHKLAAALDVPTQALHAR